MDSTQYSLIFSLLQKFLSAVVFSSAKLIYLLGQSWADLQVLGLTSAVCVVLQMMHDSPGPHILLEGKCTSPL